MIELSLAPPLFPDEHMLSGVARGLLLAGMNSLDDAQRRFLGKSVPLSSWVVVHSAMTLYMPDSQSMHERQQMLVNHSLLGFLSHGLQYQKVVSALENNITEKTWPRIPHVEKLRFAQIWRCCSFCVLEDTSKFGTAFWRVSHQLQTSITCDRHPEFKLIALCHACNAGTTDLKQQPIPNCICHQCEARLESEFFEHNELTQWIQNTGLKLFNDAGDLKTPAHHHAMRYGFANRLHAAGKIGWQRLAIVQDEFYRWCLSNNADVYFCPGTIEKQDKILNFYEMDIHQRTFPLVSLLLGFKFLGVESIEDIR